MLITLQNENENDGIILFFNKFILIFNLMLTF